MENENKETSKESNGLIERNLTGSTAQNETAPVQRPVVRRNSGNIPDRRGSNGAAERRASSYQPDRLQESVIVTPKAEPRQTRGNRLKNEENYHTVWTTLYSCVIDVTNVNSSYSRCQWNCSRNAKNANENLIVFCNILGKTTS